MSEPITIECPTCGVSMKLSDRGKLGKKAACPNCSNLFVLTEHAAQPAAGRRGEVTAGQRIRAQQEKSAGRSGNGALVGGAVVVLLLLAGVALWATGVFPGGRNVQPQPPNEPVAGEVENGRQQEEANRLDLSYLPADAELYVHLKLAEAWKSPLLMQLAAVPTVQERLTQLQETIGVEPGDVESVTFGVSGVSEQARRGAPTDPAAIAGAAGDKSVGVVRTHREVSAASLRLIENGCQKAQHDGQTYYLYQPPAEAESAEPPRKAAFLLAESKLIVFGSETQVIDAISRGGKQTRRPELDFVDPAQQLVVVFVPRDKDALTSTMQTAGGPQDPGGEMALVIARKLQGVCLGVNVGTGVDVQLQANCTDDKAAGEVKQLLDGAIAQGRESFAKSSGQLPPAIAASIEPILASLKTTASAATVTASLNVSETTVASLQQAVPRLVGMLMFGGLLPGTAEMPLAPVPTPADPPAKPLDLPTAAPEDIAVSAIVRWDDSGMYGGGDSARQPNMQLWIYLIGKQAEAAVAWGDVRIDELVADGGRVLEVQPPRFGGDDPTRGFVTVERENLLDRHPRQGVKAALQLSSPAEPVTLLTRAAGSITLRVATEEQDVVLKNAQSLAGKPLNDPAFKEAGLTLNLVKQGPQLSLKVTAGDPLGIARVEAVDAAGKRLESALVTRASFNGRVSYDLLLTGASVPADVGLKLTLRTGMQQVVVPFDVENVRVPLPPASPGQPPATTEGIREGLTLAGKAVWNESFRAFADDRPAPAPLELQVTITGSPADKAVAWGFLEVSEATIPDGTALKLQDKRASFEGSPQQGFVRVDRGGYGLPEHPPEGVRAVVTLEHPAGPLREIAAIAGTLKLLAAKETQVAAFPQFPSLAGKELSTPELQTAGLKLKLEADQNKLKLSLTEGDKLALVKLAVTDAAGKSVEQLGISRIESGGKLSYTFDSFGKKVPADAVLRVTVAVDLRQLAIPFRFEKVPVPDPAIE